MALFNGLAPNCLSKPFSAINAFALSDKFNLYPKSATRAYNFFNSISIILSISCFSKALKTITSSILFKNSGANVFFRAFSIIPLEWSSA